MNELVLYRKYRPQVFSEIIGQEHIVKTITNSLVSGNISHAYLFCGPRGSGKTTLARLLAKSVNCENRKKNQFEPCNKCMSCLEIIAGKSMDLIEIDAASHRGIDEIRELKDGIRFSPVKSKHKVFILDEAHQLTKEAANALLKILEEAPRYAIFILATTEPHKMIPTIISRCQRFDFRKLSLKEIIKRLELLVKKEGIKVEKEALEAIAINARGSFRDAESLMGQVISFANKKEISLGEIKDILGLVDINLASELVDLLIDNNTSRAIEHLNELMEKGIDIYEFLKTIINYLRQALIFKISSNTELIQGLTKEEVLKLSSQIEKLKEEEIHKMLNCFLQAEARMKYSPIPQLPIELAIVEIIGITK